MSSDAARKEPGGGAGERVFKSAGFLMAAQIVMLPMSILINAVLGRYLGPGELGRIYLVSTYAGFGMLFTTWGQGGTLPAAVARKPDSAGVVLGTALTFQLLAACVVLPCLLAFSHLTGDRWEVQEALILAFGVTLITTISSAHLDIARGLERSDLTAKLQIGQQLLNTFCVIPTVVLGGRVLAVLSVQCLIGVAAALVVSSRVRSLWNGRISVNLRELGTAARQGTPFLLLGLAMAAQPSVDAAFLSRFAPEEAIGWYAVSRRLIGVLIVPATAMSGALYPTLCRALVTDRNEYAEAILAALKVAAIFAIPAAVGCAFYPDIGVFFFNRTAFRPAEDNLVVLSLFIPMVYLTVIIGTAVVAAGRQKRWALVQAACIGVSLIADPILIRYFQSNFGNGGLGLCIASILSEMLMVICGLWMMDRSALRGVLAGQVGRCLVAGVAMGAVALGTRRLIGPWFSAPFAVLVYLGALWLQGGLNQDQMQLLKRSLRRK
jgi:O-antigen/teichoic acid export membrane protein